MSDRTSKKECRYNGTKYQLRKAAGMYWLLDMEQDGVPYKSPIPMNEAGAFIWKRMEQGMDQETIAEAVSKEYGVDPETALQDVIQFREQIRMRGGMV